MALSPGAHRGLSAELAENEEAIRARDSQPRGIGDSRHGIESHKIQAEAQITTQTINTVWKTHSSKYRGRINA